MATVHPPKRRGTGFRPPLIVDGSDMSLDTAMYIQSEGRERNLVAVRPETAPQAPVEYEPEPEPSINDPCDIEMNAEGYAPPKKTRVFYMREFVGRVGGILQAIQA